MKRFFHKKNILILGLVSLLLLVLLVSSMEGLVFKPAVPFATQPVQSTAVRPWTSPQQIPYLAILLSFVALLITIFILMPKEQRRRYFIGLLEILVAGLLILFFISQPTTSVSLPQPTLGPTEQVTPTAPGLPETPLPAVNPISYAPPVIPPWTSFLVLLAVLIPAGMVLWWLIFHRKTPAIPFKAITAIAQEALDDLDEGKDWGDTVLNCYDRMTRAVRGGRGYERLGYLTPSEFVSVLEHARLPGDPLRRLTTLFERVRYGGKRSTQPDMDEAVSCLTEIVAACQEVAR